MAKIIVTFLVGQLAPLVAKLELLTLFSTDRQDTGYTNYWMHPKGPALKTNLKYLNTSNK